MIGGVECGRNNTGIGLLNDLDEGSAINAPVEKENMGVRIVPNRGKF
jgi:hypothetical protein